MKSSKESLTSPASTTSSSPSPGDRSYFSYGAYAGVGSGVSRWGSSRFSSAQNSREPSPSPGNVSSVTRSPLTTFSKQPYLGWRSQERLNFGMTGLSVYKAPAERLAAGLSDNRKSNENLENSQKDVEEVITPTRKTEAPQSTPNIQVSVIKPEDHTTATNNNTVLAGKLLLQEQTPSAAPPTVTSTQQPSELTSSITEVTNAIVHYCNDQSTNKSSTENMDSAVPKSYQPPPRTPSPCLPEPPVRTTKRPEVLQDLQRDLDRIQVLQQEIQRDLDSMNPERSLSKPRSSLRSSGRHSPAIWMESSFVGNKPIHSPPTPDEVSIGTSELSSKDYYSSISRMSETSDGPPHNGGINISSEGEYLLAW